MNYSIEYLMDIFKKLEWENSKYRAYQKLIKNIESMIGNEKIKQIYPKFLFVEDKEIEFYTFTDKYIFITKLGEDKKSILNKCIKIKDIESLEKIEGNEYEPAILNMYFYNGEEYILNSDADTNEHHMKVFNETINEIASLLLGA